MNATQARELSLAAAPTLEQAELEQLTAKIRENASSGRYEFVTTLGISKGVRDRLESDGFRIRPGTCGGTVISWIPDQGQLYEHDGKYYIGQREVIYAEYLEQQRMHNASIQK